MSIEKALIAEKQNKIELAAQIYENIIKQENYPSIDCFINLLIIYFIANDPAERKNYELNMDFTNFGNSRTPVLLSIAKHLYPASQELLFWENYIHFILDNDSACKEIDKKFSEQHETLIPFFYFYEPKHSVFLKEAELLRAEVKDGNTCKERYIKSVLDASWKRRLFYQK